MNTRVDWREVLDKHRIEYIERGANVKRGEVNIKCPWCGSADPSQHMGINLTTGFYACWRNKQGHSGKSPVRLLMKLLRIGYAAAREFAGLGENYIDPEGFDAFAARLMGRDVAATSDVERVRTLRLDVDFMPIAGNARADRWWRYLKNRGFEDIDSLCSQYDLRAVQGGDFGGRLILPYTLEGKLVTWTGRALGPAAIRYKDLSVEDSIIPPKHTLYLHDKAAEGGHWLVVCEGPIDALKIDAYGADFGVHAVALSTNSINPQQLYLLEELAPHYVGVIVMMDAKTEYGFVDSMRMKQELATLSVPVTTTEPPFKRSDAGELKPAEVREWCGELLGG